MPSYDQEITKSSFYQINQKTGKIEKKGIQLLFPDQNPTMRLDLDNEKENYLIVALKQDGNFFLSKFDMIQMKEEWRIPFGKWILDYNGHEHEVIQDSTTPNRIFLHWGNDREMIDLNENIDPVEIPNGFYEIDTTTGKILWRSTYRCILSNGLLFFVTEAEDSNQSKIGVMDMNSHTIKWALNIKGTHLASCGLKPLTDTSCFLLRYIPDDTDLEDGYIEMANATGKLLAYYPQNWKEDHLEYVYYLKPYRYFQNKKTILLMEPE
jgi:hypothetical protein